MLFHTWRASGADPYCVYNGLTGDFRPLHDPTQAPRPPKFPERVRAFVYACAMYARELEVKDRQAMTQAIAKAVRGG